MMPADRLKRARSRPVRAALALALAAWLTAPAASAQAAPLRLQYWHAYSGAIGEAHQQLIDEFNAQHPGIQVESVYGGNLFTMRDRLAAAVSSGAAPDLASIDQFWLAELAAGGHTVPVARLASLADGLGLEDLLPQFLDAGRYQGELHALPFAVSIPVLYYNLELMSRLGLTEDDLPTTWQELLALNQRLRAGPAGGEQYWLLGTPTTAQTGVVYHFIVTLWQHGGELVEGEEVRFHSEAGVRTLELWQELVRSGALDLTMASQAWESGRLLFNLASSAQLQSGYASLPFAFGVSAMPMADYRVAGVGGRSLAVLAQAPERQAAAATFVAWLTSSEVNQEWSERTGYTPLRRASLGSAAYQQALRSDRRLERIIEQLPYTRLRPNDLWYAEVSRVLGDAVELALYRPRDPRAILEAAAAEAAELVRAAKRDEIR